MKKFVTKFIRDFMKILKCLAFVAALASSAFEFAQAGTSEKSENENSGKNELLLLVKNDSPVAELGQYSKALESAISSRIAKADLRVIDYDLALRNLNAYLDNPNSKYVTQAQVLKRDFTSPNFVDSKLFEDASGTRIAEFLGADSIMTVSILGFSRDTRKYSGCGVQTVTDTFTLTLNYRVFSASSASAIAGGNFRVSESFRNGEGLEINIGDIRAQLFENAAQSIAADFEKNKKSATKALDKIRFAGFNLSFAVSNLEFPKVVKEGEKYYITRDVMTPSFDGVNAEIDGVLYTIALSQNANINLAKGIHYLRVNQPDIKPLEQTIFVTGSPDQKIRLNLALSDELLQRWRADIEFFRSIVDKMKTTDSKVELTEAEAKRLEGLGKMFENSHIYFAPQNYGTNVFPIL